MPQIVATSLGREREGHPGATGRLDGIAAVGATRICEHRGRRTDLSLQVLVGSGDLVHGPVEWQPIQQRVGPRMRRQGHAFTRQAPQLVPSQHVARGIRVLRRRGPRSGARPPASPRHVGVT